MSQPSTLERAGLAMSLSDFFANERTNNTNKPLMSQGTNPARAGEQGLGEAGTRFEKLKSETMKESGDLSEPAKPFVVDADMNIANPIEGARYLRPAINLANYDNRNRQPSPGYKMPGATLKAKNEKPNINTGSNRKPTIKNFATRRK